MCASAECLQALCHSNSRVAEVSKIVLVFTQILLYCRAGASAADLCQLAAKSFEVPMKGNFKVQPALLNSLV